MAWIHSLGRGLLYVLIVLLGCLWTLGCFVVVMTAVCLWGFLKNCSENRTGGCHDLPLLCDGINKSVEWSAWGWRGLWSWVEPPHPQDDEEMAPSQVEPPTISPPPPALSRSSRGHVGMDRTVANLNHTFDYPRDMIRGPTF
jgi:hypothetical protein